MYNGIDDRMTVFFIPNTPLVISKNGNSGCWKIPPSSRIYTFNPALFDFTLPGKPVNHHPISLRYPLVNIQKTMENHHVQWETHYK